MTPEQEILADLLEQGKATSLSLTEALALIATFPEDQAAFEAMSTMSRVAATAMLKGVEQLEGSLAGLFRAILKAMGVSLKGLYPLDIGHRMVELEVLDDAAEWLAIVKLRNELVHEYPLAPPERFDRLTRAHAAIPVLLHALARAENLVRSRGLLP